MKSPDTQTAHVSLSDIARVFLVIGVTGFGGGMAIIALMQEACVNRRKWLSQEEFTHGVAFGQILGSFAVNAAVFVGCRLRGTAGGIVAAIAFLTPSVAAVILLSHLYFRYHHLPSLQSALNGIGPVVVALIVFAAYQMGKGAKPNVETALIAAATFAAVLFLHAPIVLLLLLVAAYGFARYSMSNGMGHDAS